MSGKTDSVNTLQIQAGAGLENCNKGSAESGKDSSKESFQRA